MPRRQQGGGDIACLVALVIALTALFVALWQRHFQRNQLTGGRLLRAFAGFGLHRHTQLDDALLQQFTNNQCLSGKKHRIFAATRRVILQLLGHGVWRNKHAIDRDPRPLLLAAGDQRGR
ncbi:hypothetical protein D3C80_1382320 [compost metagenome]